MEGLRDILDCGRIVDQFGVKRFPKFDPITGHTLVLNENEYEREAVPIHPIFLIHFMPQGKKIIKDWLIDQRSKVKGHIGPPTICNRVRAAGGGKALQSKELFFKYQPLNLLCRRLESGRVICIDANNKEIYIGGVGIAHIDMNNANNKLEAVSMLMNFKDDGGSSNDYVRAEPEWYEKFSPGFGIGHYVRDL